MSLSHRGKSGGEDAGRLVRGPRSSLGNILISGVFLLSPLDEAGLEILFEGATLISEVCALLSQTLKEQPFRKTAVMRDNLDIR